MRTFSLLSSLLVSAVAVSANMSIECNPKHQAWDWNCQTLLDRWNFQDNTLYDPRNYKCAWSGMTHYIEIGCKLLVNDSCTLVVTYGGGDHASAVGYTGAQMKAFMQQALSQCPKNNMLNAALTGILRIEQGGLCLLNDANASSCG
ncbi:hypothetical protein BDF14DRAFT_1811343 [Spinellus fusiger]|nr:hypothetical protein BDF14DRAFT_1811343 [Spinellus fusiger]